ncbi:hypothetical protein SAMN05443144_11417 [Fodinibius roseus]|uniref:Amidohydrolase-related domain-containing protein n=2 Tax=Fodinibius roseus TaxID=1194090 RepID=A0A1M5F0G7_9BACT|nr:hypothetical protein SAMN05443144_11417 [Fodinibius roseus]
MDYAGTIKPMSDYNFAIKPEAYGLPSRENLVDMRIWDLHYHGLSSHAEIMPYFDRMGVERVFSLDIARLRGGGGTVSAAEAEKNAQENIALLEKEHERMSGIIRIDPTRVEETLELIDRLIANGPCVGIKTGRPLDEPVTVAHPNYDPIIRRLAELEAIIYIHSGYMVGGEPRTYYGGTRVGEAHPGHVAELAARFPDVPLICGHQGTDWELGVRAIRPHKNVLMEFSGMDPASGAVDFAVKELGADRLVWGCHAPTRSFANELSNVYDSDMSRSQRKMILGGNLRRISASIHRRKGIPVDI